MNKTAIIKYNAGNIGSVANALGRLGLPFTVTDDPITLRNAARVIFPGVGEASTTMRYLNESGLADVIRELRQPVLGICLGMQLLCSESEEGITPGLGIFPEKVRKFEIGEKVPHMGWNSIQHDDDPFFKNLPDPSWFYFIHSYYAEKGVSCIASTSYGLEFASCLRKDNFFATQFHPEKSGSTGVVLLKNFIETKWK